MKWILCLVIILAFTLSDVGAQKINKSFDSDTISADTTYFNVGRSIELTNGTISFQFSTIDVADSLSFARIEGSRDNLNFIPLTGSAAITETTTDGFKEAYIVNDLRFIYYRLGVACAVGDTVAVSNIGVIYKTE